MTIVSGENENLLVNEDNVDPEETSNVDGHPSGIKPWDPSKIRITTKAFSLRDVADQIEDGDIDLAPEFQREYIWKQRQRTRLVESILLGIPLPAFYFNQASDGKYQVVDGVQRLSTISLFMKNGHQLLEGDLEYLKELAGASYEELDPTYYRRFRSTQIVVHVTEPQTPDEVKYDIFNRVNTLGSPLSPQEIRHAMGKPKSRDFIKQLAESDEFDIATEYAYWKRDKDLGEHVRNSARMTNRELVLRFCAFRVSSLETYRQFPSLDTFLLNFTRMIDRASANKSNQNTELSDRDLKRLAVDFKRGMDNAYEILGDSAFRRWPLGQERRGPINRALFEAQANALADYKLEDLKPYTSKIVRAFRKAFDDYEFLRAVTVGTGSPSRVEYRLDFTKKILREIVK